MRPWTVVMLVRLMTLCAGVGVVYLPVGAVSAKADNGLRLLQFGAGKPAPSVQLYFWTFEQFGNDVSRYEYFEVALGIRYQTPLPWLAFSAAYRQAHASPEDGVWNLERAPHVNLLLSRTLGRVVLSNMLRAEYRFTPTWRNLRILDFLMAAVLWGPGRLYTGLETYYEHHWREVKLLRLHLGYTAPVTRKVSLGVFLRFDSLRVEGVWTHLRNLLGVKLLCRF